MALLMKCSNGHEWEVSHGHEDEPASHLLACPVCGAQADQSTSESLGDEATFTQDELPPPPGLLSTRHIIGDRCLPPVAHKPANTPHMPGYEILRELGRGGMGVVYLARQIKLDRMVALKMLLAGPHAGDREMARFRAEAETIAQLHHPNIVNIYDIDMHDGVAYLALEYVEGKSLAQMLRGQPQSANVAAQMVRTLAQAIHAAHVKGIIHRDLKPANILLVASSQWLMARKDTETQASLTPGDGELATSIPKITDFGLAKRLDNAEQTQSGVIMGTPTYMAPEQAEGKIKEIGPATDIYALGTILYEMVTGRPPFQGATSLETIRKVVTVEPVPPSRICSVPRDLEIICLRCLQKNSRQRYVTALELSQELGGFLQMLQDDSKAGTRQVGVKRSRRKVILVLASFLIVALGVIIWKWTHSRHPDVEPEGVQVEVLNKGIVIPPEKEKDGPTPAVDVLKKGNDPKSDDGTKVIGPVQIIQPKIAPENKD